MKRLILYFFLAFAACGCLNKKPSVDEVKRVLKRINELKPHFNYQLDSFTNIHWYRPVLDTSDSSIFRSKIYMSIREDGYYNLLSIYEGDHFIYHNQLKLRINDTIYATIAIDSLEKKLFKRQLTRQDEYGLLKSYVVERLTFNSKNDGNIPKKIFYSKGPVFAVFQGTQGDIKRITLKNKEIQQIKDGYELSNLLKINVGGK